MRAAAGATATFTEKHVRIRTTIHLKHELRAWHHLMVEYKNTYHSSASTSELKDLQQQVTRLTKRQQDGQKQTDRKLDAVLAALAALRDQQPTTLPPISITGERASGPSGGAAAAAGSTAASAS